MFKILKNRNFILPFAFILGLSFPGLAQYTKSLTIPALALVMTISLSEIPTTEMLQWKKLSRPLFFGILLNYILLGSLIILLTYFLIKDTTIANGMMLVAASPPGVAIIPFTSILSGNIIFALFATFGSYLAALIITPSLSLLLSGADAFPFFELAVNLVYLIIVPIILSRFINLKKIFAIAKPWRGTIINWGLFVVIFTVIGTNQASFFKEPKIILTIAFIAFLTTFPLFILLKLLFKKFLIKEEEAIAMVLLATIKNSGFAAALALNLFGDKTSIPGAIISAVYAIYMIWLGK